MRVLQNADGATADGGVPKDVSAVSEAA